MEGKKWIDTSLACESAEVSFIDEEDLKECKTEKERILAIAKGYSPSFDFFQPEDFINGKEFLNPKTLVCDGREVFRVHSKTLWLDFIGTVVEK